jgi:3-oxoacyl-[acyl-carrier-protein] synthase-3
VADAYLKQGRFRYALVIGAETLSRLVDWQDRSTAILFGDGAGAVLLKAENSVQGAQERGLLNSRLRTGGGHYDLLYADAKGIYMNGREVFRHAVQELEAISKEVLEEGGYKQEDVDWLIPHQANKRIIDAVTQRMGVSSDKVLYAGNLHANTSAASIPLVLWKAMEEGKIKPGHLLLFQAFGAGFSSGAVLARF